MGAGGSCELGHRLWPPRISWSLYRCCLLQQVGGGSGEPGPSFLSTGLPHLTAVFAVTACGPDACCVSSHPLSEPLPLLPFPFPMPFLQIPLGIPCSGERATVRQGPETSQCSGLVLQSPPLASLLLSCALPGRNEGEPIPVRRQTGRPAG